MNQEFIVPILALGVIATLGYFRGRKKNAWISGWISRESEAVLKPADVNYVNFGGTIGYNFVYKLKGPFREAKGTFTLLPRQSVMYMPISLLVSRHDKYYLQLFAEGKLAGEGHILAKSYLSKGRRSITGFDDLHRQEYRWEDKTYFLLWDAKGMDEKLKKLLENLKHPELLRHFCCYASNKNFFLYLKPVYMKLEEFLKSLIPELKPFYIKGGSFDGPGNEKKD
jgi:hypothetical protein